MQCIKIRQCDSSSFILYSKLFGLFYSIPFPFHIYFKIYLSNILCYRWQILTDESCQDSPYNISAVLWGGTDLFVGFPGGSPGKEPACQGRRCKKRSFHPWVWKIPCSRKWQPLPVFFPGESQGKWNLVGSSPWGRKSWTWLSN